MLDDIAADCQVRSVKDEYLPLPKIKDKV